MTRLENPSRLADDCALMQDHRCIRRLHPANLFEILHGACFHLEILSSVVVWCEPGSTFTSLLPWVLTNVGRSLCHRRLAPTSNEKRWHDGRSGDQGLVE